MALHLPGLHDGVADLHLGGQRGAVGASVQAQHRVGQAHLE